MTNPLDILWREICHPSPPVFAPAELALPHRPLRALMPWRWSHFRQVDALRTQWVQNLIEADVDAMVGHLTKSLYAVPLRGDVYERSAFHRRDVMEHELLRLGERLLTHRHMLSGSRANEMFVSLNLTIPLSIEVWQVEDMGRYILGAPMFSTMQRAMDLFIPGEPALGTGPAIAVRGLPSGLAATAAPALDREMLPEMHRLGHRPDMAQVVTLWERAKSLGASSSLGDAYNLERILDDYIPTMVHGLATAVDSRDPRTSAVSTMVVSQVQRLNHYLDTLGTPSTLDGLVEALEFQDAFLQGKFSDGSPASLALPVAGECPSSPALNGV